MSKKIIYNACIVTMNKGLEIIPNGSVLIENGKICTIASTRIKDEGADYTDAHGMILLPGFVNTHTHVPMTLFRGFADDLPLHQWLTEYIFPAEAKFITPSNVHTASKLAFLEMIKSGTTCFNDMYFFEDIIAEEAKKAGIRAMLSNSLIDFPTPCFSTVQEGLAMNEQLLKEWQNDSTIHPSVCVHSPYTCCKETLQKTKALADKYDTTLHVHLAETRKEVEDMVQQTGQTPVQYFHSIGLLDKNVVAAHCVWLNEKDIELMAATHTSVAHCPKSNLKLASGMANIDRYLRAGLNVGIGTDGAASNNTLDMVEEMRFAALLPKVIDYNPEAMKACQVIQSATIQGANAIGLGQLIGSIEVGKEADLILVDMHTANMTPLYNVFSALAYALNSSNVHSSMVHGEWIMKDRKVLHIDEEAIFEEVQAIAQTIKD